jgi:prenyltransferase beta subunit
MTPPHAPVSAAQSVLPVVLAACAVLSAYAVRPALAAAPKAPNATNATNQVRLDSTVRYLQDVQNLDGGFGGEPGGESDPDFSAWVALALAAAGINPRDQSRPGGTDAYTYLAEHAGELELTTDFERALLVVDASGTSPEDFGGVHLVQQILARQLTGSPEEGAFVHEAGGRTPGVNDTIFAILALSPVPEPAVQSAIKHAVSWLIGEQNPDDGGWPAVCPRTVASCSEQAEVDMTGAAIQALNAAGLHGSESQQRAIAFLHEAQNPDGGFPEFPGNGEESNVASTAWAVQAIWAAGGNPETWIKSSGREPLDYMESLQHEDGSIQWKASSDSNPVWMTAYAAPAFAGDPWPIPAPPYVEPPSSGSAGGGTGSTPPSPGSAEPGQGGESSQPGSGVIAGGGGDGAPLFSRPQPQSKGRTPGGVRSLTSTHEKRTAKHHRDPGLRRKTTAPNTKHRRNPGPHREARAPTTTPASKPNANHSGRGHGTASVGTGSGGPQAGEPEVRGVLIGAPSGTHNKDALERGAPGLHSAGAGGNQTPWLAIGIGGAITLLALAGSQLERRRPELVL